MAGPAALKRFARALALGALAALLFVGDTLAQSNELVLRPVRGDSLNVTRGLPYLYDTSSQLEPQDLIKPLAQSAFRPYPRDEVLPREKDGAYWFQFEIAGGETRRFDHLLLFSKADVASYALYERVVPGGYNLISPDIVTGDAVGHRIRVERGEQRRFLLRIDDEDIGGALTVWQPDAWTERQRRQTVTALVAIAIAAAAGIAALILYARRRGRVPLGGAVLAFGLALFVAAQSGVVTNFWPAAQAFSAAAPALLGAGIFGFAVFARALARGGGAPVALGHALLGFGIAGLAAGIAGFFVPDPALWALLGLLAALVLLALTAAGFIGRAHSSAIWLAMGALPLGLALGLFVAKDLTNLVPSELEKPLIWGVLALASAFVTAAAFFARFSGVAPVKAEATPSFDKEEKSAEREPSLAEPKSEIVTEDEEDLPAPDVATLPYHAPQTEPESAAEPEIEPEREAGAEIDEPSPPRPAAPARPPRAEDISLPAFVRRRTPPEPPREPEPEDEPIFDTPHFADPAQSLVADLEERIRELNQNLEERDRRIAELSAASAPQSRDALTGVATREAFFHEAETILEVARRYGRPATLAMIEVEDFAPIKARYGEQISDRALKLLAVSCLKNLRDADLLARYGEHRFVAILPETDAIGAASLARRLSQTLSERTLPTPRGMLQLYASVSYTEFGEKDQGVGDLVDRAQRALDEDQPGRAAE